MKYQNNRGLTGRGIVIILVVLAGLSIWVFSTVEKFIEHTRATDAENTMNLAANAQGRQLMSKGYYVTKWTGMDLGPLSPRVKKVGDYVSRNGTTYFTRGGGENTTKSNFKIVFSDEAQGFFIVATRINSRYNYELVRKLPEDKVYCVPVSDDKRSVNFCMDFMQVSSAEQLPRDPRVEPLHSSSNLWH